jgi:hypothetical protein
VGTGRDRCLLCTGEESKSHLLLQCPETQRWREEFLKSIWPHINEEIALVLTVKNATEQRNLGTLTYRIKCKWFKQAKKAELRLGREQERDCV